MARGRRLVSVLLALAAASFAPGKSLHVDVVATARVETRRTVQKGRRTPTRTPGPSSPRPADLVPDQPFFGTPSPGEKPYLEILRMKEAGASDQALLKKIRNEKKSYFLSTYDIQKLRAAGVSANVLEAMLRSGRGPLTPAPPSPIPTAR